MTRLAHRLILAMALALPGLAPVMPLIPPAHADARPPRYDTDGLCNRRANTPEGFSDESFTRCLVDQEDSLAIIQRNWDATPTYIQDDCNERARAEGDPDYETLQNCIRVQMRQREPDAVLSPGQLAPPTPPAN